MKKISETFCGLPNPKGFGLFKVSEPEISTPKGVGLHEISVLKLLSILLLLIVVINTISALVIDSVTGLKEVFPGEVIDIEIGLKNNEDVLIEDVSVSLDIREMPLAPFESSSEYSIKEINEDKTKYAKFTLQALTTAAPGVYKIPLEISYKNENNPETILKKSIISITITSKPIVSIQLVESFVIKNQEDSIIIKIINKGLGDLKFLEIEILPSQYITFLSPTKQYVGDLDSDDFDNVELKIFAKNNAPEKINIKTLIIYKDALDNEYKEELELPLNIYTKEKAISLGLMKKSYTFEIIILIVLLIAFYFLYRYIKKMLAKRE